MRIRSHSPQVTAINCQTLALALSNARCIIAASSLHSSPPIVWQEHARRSIRNQACCTRKKTTAQKWRNEHSITADSVWSVEARSSLHD